MFLISSTGALLCPCLPPSPSSSLSSLPGWSGDLHGEPGAVLQEVLRFHHHYLVVVSGRDCGTEAQLKKEGRRPLFLLVGCHALQLNICIKKNIIRLHLTFPLFFCLFAYVLFLDDKGVSLFVWSLLWASCFYHLLSDIRNPFPFTPTCLSFPFLRLDGT